MNGVIVEYVEGIEVIKAFNQSSSSYEKFTKAVESFKDYTLKWYQSSWKVMNFVAAVLPSTFWERSRLVCISTGPAAWPRRILLCA